MKKYVKGLDVLMGSYFIINGNNDMIYREQPITLKISSIPKLFPNKLSIYSYGFSALCVLKDFYVQRWHLALEMK